MCIIGFLKDGTVKHEDWEAYNCDGNILDFREDGTVRWIDFIIEGGNNCIENSETMPIGTWERISNGKYIFTLTKTSDQSEVKIVPEQIAFENDGAETMVICYGELPNDAPDNVLYYCLRLFRN